MRQEYIDFGRKPTQVKRPPSKPEAVTTVLVEQYLVNSLALRASGAYTLISDRFAEAAEAKLRASGINVDQIIKDARKGKLVPTIDYVPDTYKDKYPASEGWTCSVMGVWSKRTRVH